MNFSKPLLKELNTIIDRRLVCTFLGLSDCNHAASPHRNQGLLLSELGAYLLGPERCRAGTKRISNLLHCDRWKAKLIGAFYVAAGNTTSRRVSGRGGKGPLVLWDESVPLRNQKVYGLNVYAQYTQARQGD